MSGPAGRQALRPVSDEHSAGEGADAGGADEPPPILGRWSRLYALVALELLVVILLLYRLTRAFD